MAAVISGAGHRPPNAPRIPLHASPGAARVAALPHQSPGLREPRHLRRALRDEPARGGAVERQAARRALRRALVFPGVPDAARDHVRRRLSRRRPTTSIRSSASNLAKPGNFALYPPNHYHYTHHQLLLQGSRARRARSRRTGSAPTTGDATCSRACCTVSGFPSLFALIVAGAVDRLRRPVRRDPGLLRRLDRHRHGALQGDLGRDAGALHADHLFVAVLAELLAARRC